MTSYNGPVDLYIGGQWLPGSAGERFNVSNPADESVLASVASGSEADARAAVDAAASAFAGWAARRPTARKTAIAAGDIWDRSVFFLDYGG